MSQKKIWTSVVFLSVVGIILASYLFYSYWYQPAFQPCSINTVVNCDAVIKGPVSTLFGIPTALYGLVGYIVILFAGLTKRKKLLLGMTSFGVLFCLRVTVIEVFFLKVLCPICLACQIIMLILFLLSIKQFRATDRHRIS
ncbi:vitamin K epoxide reductase family protein [Candidatus Roizmanbacteria bacterium]|nr:vitamin K epoxide reductase family protein [Candidatus Roizmanbacteria bacterium]